MNLKNRRKADIWEFMWSSAVEQQITLSGNILRKGVVQTGEGSVPWVCGSSAIHSCELLRTHEIPTNDLCGDAYLSESFEIQLKKKLFLSMLDCISLAYRNHVVEFIFKAILGVCSSCYNNNKKLHQF